MAGWLEQVQGLLTKEATSDREFFGNSQHPLRAIIDELGHLQMFRANPDLDPAEDEVLQQVSVLLKPLGSGAADEQAMHTIARQIAQLAGNQSSVYQRNVARVVEVSEGRDRVRRARKAVAEVLNKRYAGRKVPAMVPELLEVGWRTALELANLNSSDQDNRYADLLDLLDHLVALLGGEAFATQLPQMDPIALFERIKAELATTAFDPYKRNGIEVRLRGALLGHRSAEPQLVTMPELEGGPKDTTAEAVPEGFDEATWRDTLARCKAVRIGDRLRFPGATQHPQDLRVAWIRENHESFVLVDHRGLQVRELNLEQLATGVHQHRIQLMNIDGRPLSERAVDSILDRMQQRLAHQVVHDSLTGLIDRRQFQAKLEPILAQPERTGVLLWADIDQFRLVNDIHGYDTGDRLLIAVARLLEAEDDDQLLGHLGGDRFAVLLPEASLQQGEAWAESMCRSVHELQFDWSGQSIGLSASIGVLDLKMCEHGVEAAMHAAEHALGAAKSAGGNQIYVYRKDDPDIARQKESVQWVVQVDEALERGELHLRCQPIVPARPGEGLSPHFEVLLGVCSGSAETLPIAEFIEAAERYRRMRAVDRWVTRTVMEWIAAHRDRMPLLHGFGVNLSGQTASDPGFVEFVRQQFDKTGIDPSWLSFEITETAAMSSLSQSAGIIHDIKALGCKVALDDFGSGLASYSYLKELPIDWLKIDGVFVRKIGASTEDRAIVKSINEIGHFLGKQTIAEYVADEAIFQAVRDLGVDFAQGFAISPPHPMDDLSRPEAAPGSH
jgi:diguanylate cyclase (GGDEF)-like protein